MEEKEQVVTYNQKSKTYKMMMLFAMISIFMIFGGLTSAFVVSGSRPDWLEGFVLPSAFWYSTLCMLLSSVTFYFVVKAIKKSNRGQATVMLLLTLILGIAFVVLQFVGFNQIIDLGYRFVGSASTITTSFLYVLVLVHLLHLVGGFISLFIVIYNHSKQKYKPSQTLGIELSAMYWHFMDFIWVYLFLFFYFYN